MAENQYYDTHTLYVQTGKATHEQLSRSIAQAVDEVSQELDRNIECRFKINIVKDREGNSYGFAFVFLTNPEVYHMLLGRNPEGTDRVEYHEDPSWVAPEPEEVETPEPEPTNKTDSVTVDDWTSMSSPWSMTGYSCWADMADDEEDEEMQLLERQSKYTAPKVRVELPTLMTLPPYNYETYNDSNQKVENVGYFGVSPAYVTDMDSKYSCNVLRARDVPTWINESDIKREFSAFSSDQDTVVERTIKGIKKRDTYPFVNIVEDTHRRRGEEPASSRIVFITFDPFTKDAQFALHMMKKTSIKKKISGKSRLATLVFNHSFRTDKLLQAQNKSVNRSHNDRQRNRPPTKKVYDVDGFEVKGGAAAKAPNKRPSKGRRDCGERKDRGIDITSNPFDMLDGE